MPLRTSDPAAETAGCINYEEIKGIRPSVKAIFMSGYTDDIISKKGILEEGFELMSKPVNPDTLMRKIRDVLER